MWKKIGYTLLAFYVLALILIAIYFKGFHSLPKDLTPQQKTEWQTYRFRIQEDPNDLYAKFDLAALCAYSNRLEKATVLFNEINTGDRNFAKNALYHYQQELKGGKKGVTLFKLAVLNYIINTKESRRKTVDYLAGAVKLEPNNAWFHAYYGYALAANKKDIKGAMWHIRKAVALDEDVAVFHFLLSEGYSLQGDAELAKKEKGLALSLKMRGK